MYKIVFKIQKLTHVGVFLKREYEINVFMYVCNIPVHLFWRFSTARSCTACSCFCALHVSALLAAVFALCTFLHFLQMFLRFARFYTACSCFCALHVSALLAAVFALCPFKHCLQLCLRFARFCTACSCFCALQVHVSSRLS